MKVCNKCNQNLELRQFRFYKEKYLTVCRPCSNKYLRDRRKLTNNITVKKYEKTKKGFVVRLYRNMLSRVRGVNKNKSHLYLGKEILDKYEFYRWILSNEYFNKLFTEYEKSSYSLKLAPSVDRIDSSVGYILSNIRIVTMSDNCKNVKRKNKKQYDKRTDN